jgi:hypothetical protein
MYQLDATKRQQAISQVLGLLPSKSRTEARRTMVSLVHLFEGQDVNVIGVLYRAAEKGRFDTYSERLRKYYALHGKEVPIEVRSLPFGQDVDILRSLISPNRQRNPNYPPKLEELRRNKRAVKMELFFFDCYEEIKKLS